ncbi:MAG: hypothetical protein ACT4PL_00420 [Phycisphaerales bacterium]
MSAPEARLPSRRNGFDVILGNPPWERVKLQEQEFFAQRDPAVAGAPNASARKKAIAALEETNPTLLKEFEDATRQADGESHLMRSSGRYPLCGRGDINTYAVFAESMRDAICPTGRMGVIVPTGIATDDTTKYFFGDMVETRTLALLLSFENEEFIFPGVHHSYCFCLLIASGGAMTQEQMEFVFFARRISHLQAESGRRFILTPDDIILLNPNTLTCPVFRTERDAKITKAIYSRVPVLLREARGEQPEFNPWGLTFMAMFHMANASGLFIAPEIACSAVRESLSADPEATPPYLPLYEAKMLHQFDHRWATYAREASDWLATPILTRINKEGKPEPDVRDMTVGEKDNPGQYAAPRYWVKPLEIEGRLTKVDKDGNVVWQWTRQWLLGWRDISRANNDRTLILAFIPRIAVGHKIPLMFPAIDCANNGACISACLNSLVVDYAARQKVSGTSMSYFFLKQFPVLSPADFAATCPWDRATPLTEWIVPRVLELTYTAHDLASFARDLGYDGPPFRWDPARRAQIRAELDAAFFHLYGVSRDDAAYIMDTFLVFKARDEERNGGVYKTKETILAIFDEMAEAMGAATPARSTTAAAPAFLPPTHAQVQQGRAAAYITLLAATWAKPVERQAIEYGLVLMLNDALRAKVLAQPRVGASGGLFPARPAVAAASQPPSSPATQYVRGLDAMLGSLNANTVLKVTTSNGQGGGGMQRIELGTKGAAMAQSLPPTDRAKAKEAVAAFEILKTNLLRMESFAAVTDLEFSVV